MIDVSVVIATFGDLTWADAAWSFAYPSAGRQGASEVIVEHYEDATLAQARNQAAAKATGDWLCFLDADDQLSPGYLDAMAKAGWTPDALLVPAVQYVDRGRNVGDCEIPSWGRPLIEINCAVIGTLIPRDMFELVGGFREMPMYEDWDLWLRAAVTGAVLVPVVDAVYRASVSRGRNSGVAAAATYWRIRHEHELAYAATAR